MSVHAASFEAGLSSMGSVSSVESPATEVSARAAALHRPMATVVVRVPKVTYALRESELASPQCGLGTVVHLQLAEDVSHVVLHRTFRDAQCDRDLLVARSAGQLAQHRNF